MHGATKITMFSWMAAHARTLELDNSLFFAVSWKIFEVQKSIISHFQTFSII